MTIGYGITGIGYPMAGLGNLGLSATGTFASYDNTALGMNGSLYGMNPYMYGAYNPVNVQNMCAQVETNQLNHASNMHTILMNNQVQATTETDRAQISNMLTNASIKKDIENLQSDILLKRKNEIIHLKNMLNALQHLKENNKNSYMNYEHRDYSDIDWSKFYANF